MGKSKLINLSSLLHVHRSIQIPLPGLQSFQVVLIVGRFSEHNLAVVTTLNDMVWIVGQQISASPWHSRHLHVHTRASNSDLEPVSGQIDQSPLCVAWSNKSVPFVCVPFARALCANSANVHAPATCDTAGC